MSRLHPLAPLDSPFPHGPVHPGIAPGAGRTPRAGRTGDARLVPVHGDRPWVMGILNVTPDSFSDGGRWDSPDRAVEHGLQLLRDGADLIDVGGESTRPGAHRIDPDTERARVVPVIAELAAAGAACSVDTTRAEVAEAALDAGALLVNDVSGGLADPGMASLVAERAVPWILMHWRGPSDVMTSLARYTDVVADVRDELLRRVEAALAAGVGESSIVLDPGLGFAKDGSHNWALLRRLPELVTLGFPVLVGASRKRFLGELLPGPEGAPRPSAGREAATAAVSAEVARCGVWAVRVHEPLPSRDALAVGVMLRPDPAKADPARTSAGPPPDRSSGRRPSPADEHSENRIS